MSKHRDVKAKECQSKELCFHILHVQITKEVSQESFGFTYATVGSGRKSGKKGLFSYLQLLEVEGRLAQKLRFHIFSCWDLKEVSHKSFVFISSTVGI